MFNFFKDEEQMEKEMKDTRIISQDFGLEAISKAGKTYKPVGDDIKALKINTDFALETDEGVEMGAKGDYIVFDDDTVFLFKASDFEARYTKK